MLCISECPCRDYIQRCTSSYNHYLLRASVQMCTVQVIVRSYQHAKPASVPRSSLPVDTRTVGARPTRRSPSYMLPRLDESSPGVTFFSILSTREKRLNSPPFLTLGLPSNWLRASPSLFVQLGVRIVSCDST